MFMCHICYENFPDFHLLTNHLQSDHCSQCSICSIVFIASTDHGLSMCPKCCQADKDSINTTVEVKCEQNRFSSNNVSEVSVNVPVSHRPGCSRSSSTLPEVSETCPRNCRSNTNHHAMGTEAVPVKCEDMDVSASIRSIPVEDSYPPHHNQPAVYDCSHGNLINSCIEGEGREALSSGLVIYDCKSLEVLPLYTDVDQGDRKDSPSSLMSVVEVDRKYNSCGQLYEAYEVRKDNSREISEVKVDRKDNSCSSQMSKVDGEHQSPGISNYKARTGQKAKTRAEIQKAYRERKKLKEGDKYLEKERLRRKRAKSKTLAEKPQKYRKRKKTKKGDKERPRRQKAKTRAEIQKAYRERKKQTEGDKYREKERQRSRHNYIPNSQLNRFQKLKRNSKNRENLQKFRQRKKAVTELVKQENYDGFEEENSGFKS